MPPARLPNIGKDKAEHLVLSAVAVVAAAPVVGIGLALLLVFGAGLAKELVWDWWLGRGTPDVWDLLFDVAGIFLGAALWTAARHGQFISKKRMALRATDTEE